MLKKTVNQVGEVKISFNQAMLLDEIFSGFSFASDTAVDPNVSIPQLRYLENVDLSGFVQIDVERGS